MTCFKIPVERFLGIVQGALAIPKKSRHSVGVLFEAREGGVSLSSTGPNLVIAAHVAGQETTFDAFCLIIRKASDDLLVACKDKRAFELVIDAGLERWWVRSASGYEVGTGLYDATDSFVSPWGFLPPPTTFPTGTVPIPLNEMRALIAAAEHFAATSVAVQKSPNPGLAHVHFGCVDFAYAAVRYLMVGTPALLHAPGWALI